MSSYKYPMMPIHEWVTFKLRASKKSLNPERKLIEYGAINPGSDVVTPFTEKEGESYEFYIKYPEIIDAIADLSRN